MSGRETGQIGEVDGEAHIEARRSGGKSCPLSLAAAAWESRTASTGKFAPSLSPWFPPDTPSA